MVVLFEYMHDFQKNYIVQTLNSEKNFLQSRKMITENLVEEHRHSSEENLKKTGVSIRMMATAKTSEFTNIPGGFFICIPAGCPNKWGKKNKNKNYRVFHLFYQTYFENNSLHNERISSILGTHIPKTLRNFFVKISRQSVAMATNGGLSNFGSKNRHFRWISVALQPRSDVFGKIWVRHLVEN